jgi:hypothetical protein
MSLNPGDYPMFSAQDTARLVPVMDTQTSLRVRALPIQTTSGPKQIDRRLCDVLLHRFVFLHVRLLFFVPSRRSNVLTAFARR